MPAASLYFGDHYLSLDRYDFFGKVPSSSHFICVSDQVPKQFTKARKDAGLPDELVLYSARHTFATDMLDRTGNLRLVQQLLGHESVTTTQKYLHPEMKGIADVVNERNAERHSLRHSQDSAQS